MADHAQSLGPSPAGACRLPTARRRTCRRAARGQRRRIERGPHRSSRARAGPRLALGRPRGPARPHDTTRVGRPTSDDRPVAPRRAADAGAPSHARDRRADRPPGARSRRSRRAHHTPTAPPRSAMVRVTTAQHSSLIGGRYQIVKRIGQGGMGKVYKVNHIHLSRTFALKIISNQVAETDEARELFYREARFASAMSHPNITSVVDFGEDEKVGMFMVMEFVDGEPLNRILFREKRLVVRKACEIVLQVAEALHYIHKQNVVHCDIKTENILICEEELEGKRTQDGRQAARLRPRAPADRDRARRRRCRARRTTSRPSASAASPRRRRATSTASASCSTSCSPARCRGTAPVQKILAGHLDEQPQAAVAARSRAASIPRSRTSCCTRSRSGRPSATRTWRRSSTSCKTVMDMLGIGRRARRPGPSRRVVIEQKRPRANQRDELARVAFDACRLPLALLTPQGVIVAANPAFAKFVMGVSVEVEGLPVKSTPLAQAWSTRRAGHRAHARGQPDPPHHRDRRLAERDPPAAALARRGVRRITSSSACSRSSCSIVQARPGGRMRPHSRRCGSRSSRLCCVAGVRRRSQSSSSRSTSCRTGSRSSSSPDHTRAARRGQRLVPRRQRQRGRRARAASRTCSST